MPDIANATITGNLTGDIELRALPSGADVARLRVASNTRRRSGEEWVDKTNYYTVEVFGGQARNCAQYLHKGSRVAVEGELDWREWTDKDSGKRREAVTIKARNVVFLDTRPKTGADQPGEQGPQPTPAPVAAPTSAASTPPVPTAGAAGPPAVAATKGASTVTADDLPF
jgi:single-strand DNA-binding protein